MATVAQLDKQGVLTGYKEVAEKDHRTRKGQVALDEPCDLAPGRYRWDGERKTFVPLPPAGEPVAAEPPTPPQDNYPLLAFERLILAKGLLSLDQATGLAGVGGALDADARSWAEMQIALFGGEVKP